MPHPAAPGRRRALHKQPGASDVAGLLCTGPMRCTRTAGTVRARAWMFWMGPKWKKMAVRWYSLACGGRLPTYSVATGLAGWPASPSPSPSPASAAAPSRSAPSASSPSGAVPSHGGGLDAAPPAARASSGLPSGAPPPGDAGTLAPVLPPSRPFSRTGARAAQGQVSTLQIAWTDLVTAPRVILVSTDDCGRKQPPAMHAQTEKIGLAHKQHAGLCSLTSCCKIVLTVCRLVGCKRASTGWQADPAQPWPRPQRHGRRDGLAGAWGRTGGQGGGGRVGLPVHGARDRAERQRDRVAARGRRGSRRGGRRARAAAQRVAAQVAGRGAVPRHGALVLADVNARQTCGKPPAHSIHVDIQETECQETARRAAQHCALVQTDAHARHAYPGQKLGLFTGRSRSTPPFLRTTRREGVHAGMPAARRMRCSSTR